MNETIFKSLTLLEKLELISEELKDDIILLPMCTKKTIESHLKTYNKYITIIIAEVEKHE